MWYQNRNDGTVAQQIFNRHLSQAFFFLMPEFPNLLIFLCKDPVRLIGFYQTGTYKVFFLSPFFVLLKSLTILVQMFTTVFTVYQDGRGVVSRCSRFHLSM